MIGWVKLYRRLIKWEFYTDIPVKVLWIHLLLRANFTRVELNGGFILHEGYLLTSYRKLADETGLSVQQVRTAIKKLEATHQIALSVTGQATQRQTLIHILKWREYQCFNGQTGEKGIFINTAVNTYRQQISTNYKDFKEGF